MALPANLAQFDVIPVGRLSMANLHSYIVRYDSGFAPNPFHNFCTLATCKPGIRRYAEIGDWIVGTGSNRKGVRRGGFLVHAMRVTAESTFAEYWNDPRFEKKKPNLDGSYRMACGDNVYCPNDAGGWNQLNSYHSNSDGSPMQSHINRDTAVDRVLISEDFVYFGAEGPQIPNTLKAANLVVPGIGRKKIQDVSVIQSFEDWIRGLNVKGYQGKPFDMVELAAKRK